MDHLSYKKSTIPISPGNFSFEKKLDSRNDSENGRLEFKTELGKNLPSFGANAELDDSGEDSPNFQVQNVYSKY